MGLADIRFDRKDFRASVVDSLQRYCVSKVPRFPQHSMYNFVFRFTFKAQGGAKIA